MMRWLYWIVFHLLTRVAFRTPAGTPPRANRRPELTARHVQPNPPP
jgi:hypothetical protein